MNIIWFKPNTTYFKHSFIYSAISLWNDLLSFVKSATNLKSFECLQTIHFKQLLIFLSITD